MRDSRFRADDRSLFYAPKLCSEPFFALLEAELPLWRWTRY